MKNIEKDVFSKFKPYGCIIEKIHYYFDYVQDCFVVVLKIGSYNFAKKLQDKEIELMLFSPSSIFIKDIENRNQISELELLDYSDDGYDLDIRYRLHDIEDEQINICFAKYLIVSQVK